MKKKVLCLCMVVAVLCSACGNKNEGNLQTTDEDKILMTEMYESNIGNNEVTSEKSDDKKNSDKININEIISGNGYELGNLQCNLVCLGYVCENDNNLYYRDFNYDSSLCVMDKDGNKKVLTPDKPTAIQVVGDYVYYVVADDENEMARRIKRIPKTGGEAEVLGKNKSGSMLVLDDCIYYSGGDYVGKLTKDGKSEEIVYEQKENGDFGWFNIYGDCIITSGVLYGNTLWAIKLDGSGVYEIDKQMMFPYVSDDNIMGVNKKGMLQIISMTDNEKKIYDNISTSMTLCDENCVYFQGQAGISVINIRTGDISDIYCHDNGYINGNRIDLCGIALSRIYFKETNNSKGITEFKYVDIKTGETALVK